MSIQRCIDEQAKCARYLAGETDEQAAVYGHQDREGAKRGAEDWLMEEAILWAEAKA